MIPDEILTYKVEEARACQKTVSGPRWLGRLVRALGLSWVSCHWFRVWGLGVMWESGWTSTNDLKWTAKTLSYKLSIGPLLVNGLTPLWLAKPYGDRVNELSKNGKLGRY